MMIMQMLGIMRIMTAWFDKKRRAGGARGPRAQGDSGGTLAGSMAEGGQTKGVGIIFNPVHHTVHSIRFCMSMRYFS